LFSSRPLNLLYLAILLSGNHGASAIPKELLQIVSVGAPFAVLVIAMPNGGEQMPQGDKSKYTSKQKRKEEHIAEGYQDKGVSKKEAKSRAWATVNKDSGGGKKSGSGRGKKESHSSSRKGGKKGGRK